MPQKTSGTKGPRLVGGNQEEETSQIIDITQIRAQKLEEKRKNAERVFFRKILGVYSMAGRDSMFAIELIDVSDDGLSFQIPYDSKKPWPKDMVQFPVRLYFSQNTFFEVPVTIQNTRHAIENHEKYIRFGCAVDKESRTYPAYVSFVAFLRNYTELCQEDKGDVHIFYL